MEPSRSFEIFPSHDLDINATFNGTNSSATLTSISLPLTVVTIPAIMFACGVFGNVFALLVLYCSSRDNGNSVFYNLVCGLLLTDLFGTCATSPVTIMVYINGRKWVGGQILCNYFSFMMIFSGMATVLIVGAMALERYTAILHPFRYAVIFSSRRVRCILFGVWVFALAVACLPLVGLGKNVIQYPGTWCFFVCFSDHLTDKIFTYFYASVGLVVIAMTAVCNVSVMRVLSRMRSKQHSFARAAQKGLLDEEAQMMILLAGIILVFAACYVPLMVRVIINQSGNFDVNHSADLWAIRLASLNQILDPWVYILFRKQVLSKLSRVVCCALCTGGRQTTSSVMVTKSDRRGKCKHPVTNQTDVDTLDTEEYQCAMKASKIQLMRASICCGSSDRKSVKRNGSGVRLIPMGQCGSYKSTSVNDDSQYRTEILRTCDRVCPYIDEESV